MYIVHYGYYPTYEPTLYIKSSHPQSAFKYILNNNKYLSYFANEYEYFWQNYGTMEI